MPNTINYLKTLPPETIKKIHDDYLNGVTVWQIAKEIKIYYGIITKIVIGLGIYEQRGKKYGFKLQELPATPYSINEMHYGTKGKGKYNLHELSFEERRLFKHDNHNELKKRIFVKNKSVNTLK